MHTYTDTLRDAVINHEWFCNGLRKMQIDSCTMRTKVKWYILKFEFRLRETLLKLSGIGKYFAEFT